MNIYSGIPKRLSGFFLQPLTTFSQPGSHIRKEKKKKENSLPRIAATPARPFCLASSSPWSEQLVALNLEVDSLEAGRVGRSRDGAKGHPMSYLAEEKPTVTQTGPPALNQSQLVRGQRNWSEPSGKALLALLLRAGGSTNEKQVAPWVGRAGALTGVRLGADWWVGPEGPPTPLAVLCPEVSAFAPHTSEMAIGL